MREALKRALLLILLLPSAVLAQNRDPEKARIVTEDINRFWEAFDRAAPEFPEEPFESLYLSRGTPGLKDFVTLRIGGAKELAETVRKAPRYYASIRESTLRIKEMEPSIRASFRALKDLYPDAVFPDVYFLIGRQTSGGTTSERGLLIGAEMYGRTPGMPEEELTDWLKQVLSPVDRIPQIVAHELIHFEQKNQGSKGLLGQAIHEGSADFIAELIAGRHINHHVHEWADPREAELWQEFRLKMHGEGYAGWLYGGVPAPDGRPADLGYWMGYKITKAYYDRAADKRQAIREILDIQDFDAFLAKSGYAEKFDLIPKHGGYRKLVSFQVAQLVYDVTVRFCEQYVDPRSRTRDQMVQAARSRVQNIAEGSLASGTSKKSELKLTNVARASLEELRLDYEDFLRQRDLPLWPPHHAALMRFKARRCSTVGEVRAWVEAEHGRSRTNRDTHGQPGRRSVSVGESPCSSVSSSTLVANAALSLLNLCCHLLDRQLTALAKAFAEEGGFTERLYRIRRRARGGTLS